MATVFEPELDDHPN